MCEVMRELGIAVDGGKDSLSMTTRVSDGIVKAPGMQHTLVLLRAGFFMSKLTSRLPNLGARLIHELTSVAFFRGKINWS